MAQPGQAPKPAPELTAWHFFGLGFFLLARQQQGGESSSPSGAGNQVPAPHLPEDAVPLAWACQRSQPGQAETSAHPKGCLELGTSPAKPALLYQRCSPVPKRRRTSLCNEGVAGRRSNLLSPPFRPHATRCSCNSSDQPLRPAVPQIHPFPTGTARAAGPRAPAAGWK